ncbi:MAG: hypothetical protein ACKORI_02135, partial [Verrucomicrobiota bacterium]
AEAVRRLMEFARTNGSGRTVVVGTSAMREAKGSKELARMIHDATGFPVSVLSGESEARVVGRGVMTDRAYASYPSLLAFDLGGLAHLVLRDAVVGARREDAHLFGRPGDLAAVGGVEDRGLQRIGPDVDDGDALHVRTVGRP